MGPEKLVGAAMELVVGKVMCVVGEPEELAVGPKELVGAAVELVGGTEVLAEEKNAVFVFAGSNWTES